MTTAALAALMVTLTLTLLALRPAPRAQADVPPPQVLVVGDSLGFGLQPFLPTMLAGRMITWNVVRGRTTPSGMRALRIALLTVVPQTVVISLGTNDGPNPQKFSSRVRRILRSIPRAACIVWPAIWRPRRKGAYHGLNRVLRREARRDPRMTIIPWDRAIAKRTVVLPDGLHPSSKGFGFRSHVIAAAVNRGCGPPAPADALPRA